MLQMTAIFPLSSPWAGYRRVLHHWAALAAAAADKPSDNIYGFSSCLRKYFDLHLKQNLIWVSAVSRSSPLFGGNEQIMKQWLSHSERGPTPRTLYFWNVYLVLRRDSGAPIHRRIRCENRNTYNVTMILNGIHSLDKMESLLRGALDRPLIEFTYSISSVSRAPRSSNSLLSKVWSLFRIIVNVDIRCKPPW